MEKDILNDLYYGRISPTEVSFHKDSAFGKALVESVALSEKIQSLLPDDSKELIRKLESANTIVLDEAQREYFQFGFRLGARTMLSILTGDSNTFEEIG